MMGDLKKDIDKLIEHYDNQESGLIGMGINCYLRGVRDALDGADIDHIQKNIEAMCGL